MRAVATLGWDRAMEKTGQQAKAVKSAINAQWIYPPVGSPETILAKVGRFSNG